MTLIKTIYFLLRLLKLCVITMYVKFPKALSTLHDFSKMKLIKVNNVCLTVHK